MIKPGQERQYGCAQVHPDLDTSRIASAVLRGALSDRCSHWTFSAAPAKPIELTDRICTAFAEHCDI